MLPTLVITFHLLFREISTPTPRVFGPVDFAPGTEDFYPAFHHVPASNAQLPVRKYIMVRYLADIGSFSIWSIFQLLLCAPRFFLHATWDRFALGKSV